jgi:hypothetical protein
MYYTEILPINIIVLKSEHRDLEAREKMIMREQQICTREEEKRN